MIRRLLLLVGLLSLVLALAITGALSILRADEMVEVFPLPADVLDLPVPIGSNARGTAPTPSPAGAVSPSIKTAESTTAILQSGLFGYTGCSDTYIQFYLPTENYCQSPELYLVTSNKAATWLRFDLTALPDSIIGLDSNAVILEATLELYATQGNKDVVMGIYLPYEPWDPCTITWNTPWEKPGADGPSDREQNPRIEATSKQGTGWIEFDITGLVQNWLREPAQNHGMIIKSFDVSVAAHCIFFSSDYPGGEERPKLTIRYEPASPTPTPTSTPTATRTPVPTATSGSTPFATPTLILPLSPRVVELHWRNEMDIDGSYPIQMIFRPETADALSSLMRLYRLTVRAQVTAPTFDVTENHPATQLLQQPEDTLSWSWQVEPRVLGAQTMSLDLLFSWSPAAEDAPALGVEPGAWYQTKVIKVIEPFRYWAQVALLRSLLVVIGLACVVGWYVLRGRTKSRLLGD